MSFSCNLQERLYFSYSFSSSVAKVGSFYLISVIILHNFSPKYVQKSCKKSREIIRALSDNVINYMVHLDFEVIAPTVRSFYKR